MIEWYWKEERKKITYNSFVTLSHRSFKQHLLLFPDRQKVHGDDVLRKLLTVWEDSKVLCLDKVEGANGRLIADVDPINITSTLTRRAALDLHDLPKPSPQFCLGQ